MKMKRKALELETWVQIWPLQFTSWVTLGESTSGPQIPHLQGGNDDNEVAAVEGRGAD